jgi:SAM-dependent methyltransferase
MIRNRFHLETRALPGQCSSETESGLFRADLHELPLRNNSLDAMVLHHVLETSEDPRGAMREVARTLAPGGRLLIVSFNPWSLWGIRGAYARFFKDSFSGLRFVSSHRLQDWLAVLGFELQQDVKYLAYELPFSAGSRAKDPRPEDDAQDGAEHSPGIWQKLRTICADRRLPLGGVYVISAVKQASAMRPDWSRNTVAGRKLVPAAYPKLSARVSYLPDAAATAGSEGTEDPG